MAAPLPLASSPQWQRTRWLLRRSLVDQGCRHSIRSPVALRNGVHHSACHPRATWGLLCGTLTISEAIAALMIHSLRHTLSFVSWNVRWLTDPFSDQGTRKRAVIQGNLAVGRPALLQETHWSPATYERFIGSFPDVQVFASCAPCAPGGDPERPCGGVAILLPNHWHAVAAERIPGYCLDVDTTPPGHVQPCVKGYSPLS